MTAGLASLRVSLGEGSKTSFSVPANALVPVILLYSACLKSAFRNVNAAQRDVFEVCVGLGVYGSTSGQFLKSIPRISFLECHSTSVSVRVSFQ